MNKSFESLNEKLRILKEGEEIGLTPEEAVIYGISYSDEFPFDEENSKEGEEDEQ
ncbi:hypothetical protein [Sphingobacterium multivorum]|uniref:hypothetical protein n=1 Tax=Sphingobacterium multivorum TaxID=28454 RepID=UPI0028ACAF55|nr:hypothetical protein [Sphingobacterium multivorum]